MLSFWQGGRKQVPLCLLLLWLMAKAQLVFSNRWCPLWEGAGVILGPLTGSKMAQEPDSAPLELLLQGIPEAVGTLVYGSPPQLFQLGH